MKCFLKTMYLMPFVEPSAGARKTPLPRGVFLLTCFLDVQCMVVSDLRRGSLLVAEDSVVPA